MGAGAQAEAGGAASAEKFGGEGPGVPGWRSGGAGAGAMGAGAGGGAGAEAARRAQSPWSCAAGAAQS